MKSYFIANGTVNLHVLENGEKTDNSPSLLVIGGLWEPAERAIPILSELSSHTVAFSFRGRGLSSTPENGYDLDDHLSDIEAVVKSCGLKDYCVLGFSRGASYALSWSLKEQHNMSGLILVDQPPLHTKPGEGYVDFWSNLVYLGVPILNFMRKSALKGLEREAVQVDFSSRLKELNLPVTFFVGKNKSSIIPSDITEEILHSYQTSIPDCKIIEFLESGHMIPDEEQKKYLDEIQMFIKKLAIGHNTI